MELHRQVGVISGADEREREDTPNGVEEQKGRETHHMEMLEPGTDELLSGACGLFFTPAASALALAKFRRKKQLVRRCGVQPQSAWLHCGSSRLTYYTSSAGGRGPFGG